MIDNMKLKLCECGCGNPVVNPGNRYIYGHQHRTEHYWKSQESQLCECGCGEYAKPGNRYIKGHESRTERYWKLKSEPQLCECGCGNYAKPGNKFITGHNNRGKDYWDPEPEPQLCGCGCGDYAKPGNRYIHGHQTRGKEYWKSQENPQLCECGCGEYTEPGNKFIRGHNRKGVEHTEETCGKMSVSQTKRFEDPLEREKDRLGQLRRYGDSEEHEKTSRGSINAHINDPTLCERMSAGQQGQDYDAGEWTGYTDKRRPHLVPKGKCIHLNKKFSNSVAHHITESIILYIPVELHKHIYHNLEKGTNMDTINILGLQFINGYYDE